MGLPFLSVTVTVSITSCESTENFAMPAAGAAAGGVCCAGVAGGGAVCCAAAISSQLKKVAVTFRIWLEPHPEISHQLTHLRRTGRQAELAVVDVGHPASVGHVIEQIGGVETDIRIDPVTH